MFRHVLRSWVCLAVLGTLASNAYASGCYAFQQDVYDNGNWTWSASFITRAHAEWSRRNALLTNKNENVRKVKNRCNPADSIRRDYEETLLKVLKEVRYHSKRAKLLRDWGLRNVGKLSEQQFNAINAAIDKYNVALGSAQRGPNGNRFRSFSPIPRVPRTVIRAQYVYVVWYTARGRSIKYKYREYRSAAQAQSAMNYLRSRYGRYGYRFGYQAVRR